MTYIPNPKLEGSDIVGCVPQDGFCPVGCSDCFFNRPENYLGSMPKANIPPVEITDGKIVRINDVNDSYNNHALVRRVASRYAHKFYNTSCAKELDLFYDPIVLTVNPGRHTDRCCTLLTHIPDNLMFVRVRVNTWNLPLVDTAVRHYTKLDIPVVLTYMVYYKSPVPEDHLRHYRRKVRLLNESWCIKPEVWIKIAKRYSGDTLIFTCGAGPDKHLCKDCGTCAKLYRQCKSGQDR